MYFVAKPNEEAKSFIQAAGLIDETQMKAIGTLVFDLKNYNIWDKMKAIYPMVGQAGVSSSFQFNLKNPALFKGTFSGSWIFSSTGATPDGTSAYMNTGYNPTLVTNQDNLSFSYYSRTNNTKDAYDIGAQDSNTSTAILIYISGLHYYSNNNGGTYNTQTSINTLGHFINTRISPSTMKLIKNGNVLNISNRDTVANINANMYVGAFNLGGPFGFTDRQCSFSHFGDGLTDTEAANLYTAVQRFQTTLGRQV
jgi:hypothetical protein